MLTSRKNKTVWGNPEHKLQSQFGFISYAEWCAKESARMNAQGANTHVVWDQGMCCIQNA
jgi:hypothetical protein